MTKLTITQGNIASGKSRFAYKRLKESPLDTIIAERDQIRMQLYHGFRKCDKLTNRQEEAVTKFQNKLIEDHLKDGYNVIVSDTNLYPDSISRFNKLAQKHGAEFEVVRFTDVPVEVCIGRNSRRPEDERIPKHVIHRFQKRIDKMNKKKNKKEDRPLVVNSNKQNAIVCDVDGTIRLISGRSPYDSKNAHRDIPNVSVISMITGMKVAYPDLKLIIVSGASGDSKSVIEEQMSDYDIEYDEMFIRKIGDNRKDTIIKKEIYDEQIAPKYNVMFVVDDRKSVCEMWREQGLHCFQVDFGDF